MTPMSKVQQTTVGSVSQAVLDFTAGRDVELDKALVEADCLGTAAHVTMLSELATKPAVMTAAERKRVVQELVSLMKLARNGKFRITLKDQDVHLALERYLTKALSDLGKRVHTGRSRNDQVAVDLRLYGKEQLLDSLEETSRLALALIDFGRKHATTPMVGRTHMQKAMPSSVGLWATSHAEGLLDDAVLLVTAYDLNDQCPLGSAAGYGVPLPIDRERVSDLLGFSRPIHNVLYASSARGKMESIILQAMSQIMVTLSRLAQDLMLYTMPEFGYFVLPNEFCTGSSIMPQKNNPDVLELVRAKASGVAARASAVQDLLRGASTGYNRDLQEAKEPFMEGVATTRSCLQIVEPLIRGLKTDRAKLLAGFTPEVFATDRVLELVAGGSAFRDAYQQVKEELDTLENQDPQAAVNQKTHLGGPAGVDYAGLRSRAKEAIALAKDERTLFHRSLSKLLGVRYPAGVKG